MKRFLAISALILCVQGAASADYFRFRGADGFFLGNAPAYISGRQYGYTDEYGRLFVDIPAGDYEIVVFRNNRGHRFRVRVTGDNSQVVTVDELR